MEPFQNISSRNQKILLRNFEASKLFFKKNSSIFQNVIGDNLIGIIVYGSLQIIKTDYNGNQSLIEELNENDIFGAIISHINSNEYEIITKEDTLLYVFDYDQVLNLNLNTESYNQFLKNILQITTSKMQEKNERIEILTKKTIRNRLLEYFNITSSNHGSRIIYLPFTFTDLADYLAIDRCAMSRELKYLKEEGLIAIKGRRITLLYDKV